MNKLRRCSMEINELVQTLEQRRDEASVQVDSEDFGTICICAVRYACGRQSYMPGLVIDFLTPLIPKLSNKTLCVIERDVREAERYGGYGDENIDKPGWIKFLGELQAEIQHRKIERW